MSIFKLSVGAVKSTLYDSKLFDLKPVSRAVKSLFDIELGKHATTYRIDSAYQTGSFDEKNGLIAINLF